MERFIEGAGGFNPLGDVGARPEPLRATADAGDTRFDEGEPAWNAVDGADLHLHAGDAVGMLLADSLLQDLEFGRRAEQRQGLHTEETPESVIGECDAALRVPLDDDVGGRLNEGAVALLAFRDPPDAILKPLDLGRVRGRLPPRAGSRVNRSDGHQRDQDENDLRRDHRPLRPEAWADRRRPGHGAAGHRCPPSRARSIPVPRIPP